MNQPWNTARPDGVLPPPVAAAVAAHGGRRQSAGVLPATGTAVVASRPAGVEETVTLAVAQPGLEPPDAGAVRDVVARLAEEVELVTVLVTAAGAAADTTSYPHFTGFPGPVGLAIGPAETRPTVGRPGGGA